MKAARLACQKLTDIHGRGHVQYSYSFLHGQSHERPQVNKRIWGSELHKWT